MYAFPDLSYLPMAAEKFCAMLSEAGYDLEQDISWRHEPVLEHVEEGWRFRARIFLEGVEEGENA